MDLAPNTTNEPPLSGPMVEEAEQIVAHIQSLEATPAWQWLRANWETERDRLADTVLHDAKLSPEERERTRRAYVTLKQSLDNIERSMQTSLAILLKAQRLPAQLLPRLVMSKAPSGEPTAESLSPFAQAAMDVSMLFGNPNKNPSEL